VPQRNKFSPLNRLSALGSVLIRISGCVPVRGCKRRRSCDNSLLTFVAGGNERRGRFLVEGEKMLDALAVVFKRLRAVTEFNGAVEVGARAYLFKSWKNSWLLSPAWRTMLFTICLGRSKRA